MLLIFSNHKYDFYYMKGSAQVVQRALTFTLNI